MPDGNGAIVWTKTILNGPSMSGFNFLFHDYIFDMNQLSQLIRYFVILDKIGNPEDFFHTYQVESTTPGRPNLVGKSFC